MSLLRDIQDGATEDSVSLATLLRKVKLLATRLGVREIAEWVGRELSGYEDNAELPSYRGPFGATVVGDAMGPFGLQYKNYPFPEMALAEKYRDSHLFKLYFMQGVAELESLAAAKETVHVRWPADIVASLPMLTEGGLIKWDSPMTQWVAMRKVIPYPTIVGVLDAIRNRLLDFSMQVEEEEPSVENEQRLADPERMRIIQTFHTTVYAGSANVAFGNRDVNQTQEFPAPSDTDGLMRYLRQLGIDDKMIDRLQDALREDANESHDVESFKGPGQRALKWLKDVLKTSASQVGVPVATTLITQALLHYFGL